MKKIIYVLCFIFLLTTPLSTYATQSTVSTEFSQKVSLFSAFLKHSFGRNNPFRDRCVTLLLTEELSLMLGKGPSSESTEKHKTQLKAFLIKMETMLDHAQHVFGNQEQNMNVLKDFTQITNEALFYINAHLGSYVPHCTATKKFVQKQKRFIGSLLGVSIASGTLRYILLGVFGAAILSTIYSILNYLTRDIDEACRDIENNQRALQAAIDNYCTAACNYCNPENPRGVKEMPIPLRHGGSIWQRVKNAFGNIPRRVKNKMRSHGTNTRQRRQENQAAINGLITTLRREYPSQQGNLNKAQACFFSWMNTN